MSKASHKTVFFLSLAMIAFIVYHCANPRPPSGGPKDIYPPIIIRTSPANYTSNFTEKRIQLYFDEFVKLNDVANQVFISPPQYEMPEITARGKSVIIELQDELLENTTYSIFLGEAIVDITESNPVDNYSFVFSTGDRIDSLAIIGEVRNAFNMELEPDVLVMLYNERYDTVPADSAPYLLRPVYVSKTYDDGKFALISLREGRYRLFALKDMNSNFIFDQPGEKIAFCDSMVIPAYPVDMAVVDSVLADTLAIPDTSLIDTAGVYPDNPYFHLMLFQEIDSTQRLLDARLSREKLLTFVYRYPPVNPSVEFIDIEVDQDSIIDEWNRNRDTLSRWLLAVPADSALFKVMDDTLVLDTVELPLKESESQGFFRRKEEKIPDPLKFKNNIRKSQLDFSKPLALYFSYPLAEWDFSHAWLITPKDTLIPEIKLEDSLVKRIAVLDYDWKENTNYTLIIDDSIMTDIIGRMNDSTVLSFATKTLEDYGSLIVDINLPGDSMPYIIQLLDDKEKILDQRTMLISGIQNYDLLIPRKYKLKAIRDANRNGRWDTGNYLQGLQPEQVFYFEKVSDVRPNWELEEKWVIE
jgi:hypothetical protein